MQQKHLHETYFVFSNTKGGGVSDNLHIQSVQHIGHVPEYCASMGKQDALPKLGLIVTKCTV